MAAKGFCVCKRDFPQREDFHPPEGATWHFLCDKPVLTADLVTIAECGHPVDTCCECGSFGGSEWDEAERIAEVFDEARAELDRGL